MIISPAQIKAARAMLDWSAEDLGKKIGVVKTTISAIETGRSHGSVEVLNAITHALELGGIEFADGGVRPRQNRVQILNGAEGFRKLMDDVYETCKNSSGGEICVYNAKPDNWIKWLGKEWNEFHSNRMKEIAHKLTYRITSQKGDWNFIGRKHAEYRWVPDHLWDERSFYVYGNKLAFINFQENSVDVFVLEQQEFSESFRSMFKVIWETVTIIPDENSAPGKNKK